MVTANGTATRKARSQAAESPTVLHELDNRRIGIAIRGTTPYICHAWSEKAIRMMEESQQKKARKGREPKNPQEEFEGCFYRNDDGDYCIPARSFKKAMVAAATSIGDKTNFPMTKIRQAIFVIGDLLPIEYTQEPVMRTDPVMLNKKTADLRYRPEFRDWRVMLNIEFNAAVVSQEQVVNLINLAGFAVGVGEWRPEKDGVNGRFEVERAH